MPRIWAQKFFYLKISDYPKACFVHFFSEQSLKKSLIFTLNSFQRMLKVSSCSVHELIFVEADGKGQFPVTGPLYSHEFDHGLEVFHDHLVPQCWEASLPGLLKISLIGH